MLTIGAPSRLHGLIERLRAIAQLSAALDSIAVEMNRSRRNAKFTFSLDDDCYDLLLSRTIFQRSVDNSRNCSLSKRCWKLSFQLNFNVDKLNNVAKFIIYQNVINIMIYIM